MLRKLVLGLIVVFSLAVSPADAGHISGTAGKIVDGDTLWVCDASACHKIRLCGIDAPDLRDPGGQNARGALEALIEHENVTCTPVGEGTPCDGRSARTSYDRIVAQCFVGATDLADALVQAGHACDWVRYSNGYYSDQPGRPVCEQ